MSDTVEIVDIEESIKSSYLEYSMSVIVGRALPDVRDGLKPVHRRILYAMDELNLGSRQPYKKSARIVGDVIGKYHPHGDIAVYDALVRMAQSFSMRVPAIDGQGNFGSVDGDSPAAMRYTEARMSALAEELLKDIDKETVDFVPNYDESTKEPDVLPARVPNLLLNGSSGIAVGMATNIPPHSLDELVDGLLCLLENKDASLEEIMEHIKGPDFPTGGVIFGRRGILEAYSTGRGRVKMRAKTRIETRGNKEQIIVYELPYQVNKAKLHAQIHELAKEKIIEGISEVRDESDREGMRLVIELRRDAMSEIVLNNLFKHTAMDSTFGIIMLAIENKEPKIFTLLGMLQVFLKHRKTVIIRRCIYELEKARARAHILEGLCIALDNIDAVIALIKASKDAPEAKAALISNFALSEVQAAAILDMRLQRLTGLEREKIDAELKELIAEIARLEEILANEHLIEKLIKEELLEIKDKFKVARKTEIVDDYDDLDIEDLMVNENMVVTITHRGYIKRVPSKTYERQKRGGKGKIAVTTYDDDFIESFFVANSLDTLLFITDRGQLYWLKVYKIPEAGRTAKGKAVVNLINLQENEKIKAIIPTTDFSADKSLIFFTKLGLVKRSNLAEYKNIRSLGVRALNLQDDDEVVTALVVDNDGLEPIIEEGEGSSAQDSLFDEVAQECEEEESSTEELGKMLLVATKNGMCLKFLLSRLRQIGRAARGVRAIRLAKDDEVVGAVVISSNEEELLSISQKGLGKRTTASEYRLTNRGGKGVICMKLNNRSKHLISILMVDESMDLMALTSGGKMIRVDMQTVRKVGRNSSGVIVVNVEKDEVLSIAKCPKQEDDEDEASDDGNSVNDSSEASDE